MVKHPTSPSRLPGSTSGSSTYSWSPVGEFGTVFEEAWTLLKLQRETFRISDIPSLVGFQKRPPSAGMEERALFQTIQVML